MPSSNGSAMPLAIVIAGGLVGLGLYMGLRSSAPQAPTAPAPPSAAKTAEAESKTADSKAPPTEPVPDKKTGEELATLQQTVERQALAAVEAKREEIVTKCWNPSAEKNPEPAKVNVGLSLSFRATGVVVASGTIANREAARHDMMDCIGAIAHGIEIPPPGQSISVEVYFDLPLQGG